MVLNGPGFIERRLYLFPDFFDDIAVERPLGEGITRDHLNDDVLGRTLDAIAAYGPTRLFNEIVAKCLLPTEFGSHCVHIDTTNFSVSGAYESDLNIGERRGSSHRRWRSGKDRVEPVRASTVNGNLEPVMWSAPVQSFSLIPSCSTLRLTKPTKCL